MISIREDQIKGIVEDLQEYGFLECHRVPAHVVHSAVCKWLESHIHSLTEDAVWWFTKGKDLRDCGLPYEDEIQEYQEEGDRALTVGDKFQGEAWGKLPPATKEKDSTEDRNDP